MLLRKIIIFIKKDFLIQKSYKLNFIIIWFTIPLQIGIFYFIAKLVGDSASPHLKKYGSEYFPFVLIGLAFYSYLFIALKNLAKNIREEQIMGTLEAILLTPTKISTLVVSLPGWSFLFALINIIIYLSLGICFPGVKFVNVDIFAISIILFLTIVSCSSIGMLSVAFVMVFKKGDLNIWLISMFSAFFGGAYFPIELLPKGLQYISNVLPFTYSLRALRYALLQGYNLKMLNYDIGILSILCIILFLSSLWLFKYAVKKLKKDGSLAHY